MDIEKNYFKMSKDEFESYINYLKRSDNAIFLFKNKYFFIPTIEIVNLVATLHTKMFELDNLVNSFSNFAKKQIVQSFLIDEIETTNKIENINSTRHDIFSIISKAASSKDKKIIFISNAYASLLKTNGIKIENLSDIRKSYEEVLNGAIEKNDLPDGIYFRKGPVFISNGIRPIHIGISGKTNINESMEEFIKLYNSKTEVFIKMILCHFIFEFTHPFYDGNGRFGRYLFSNGLYLETKSYFSLIIASSLNKEKGKYYKALSLAEDRYEFGCVNTYVEAFINILLDGINLAIKDLTKKKEAITQNKPDSILTKSEEMIYSLIVEASFLSLFGVSNEEIIEETGVSKRTLINTLNKLKAKEKLIDTKIGRITYHKFN